MFNIFEHRFYNMNLAAEIIQKIPFLSFILLFVGFFDIFVGE